MYYYIYKTTNKVNGKFYIGAHSTKTLNDGYLGSGVALKKAIEKYGKDVFVVEILKICDTKEEMWLLEEALVDKNDPMSYNMRNGGKGGFDHIDIAGEKNPMKRKEVLEKHIKNRQENGSFYTEKVKQHMENITKIAATRNKGKKRPEHSKLMSLKQKDMWLNNKEKMRDCLSSTFEVSSNTGAIYITNRLQDFCKENGLAYTSLWKTSTNQKPTKKGKNKGWTCKIIHI